MTTLNGTASKMFNFLTENIINWKEQNHNSTEEGSWHPYHETETDTIPLLSPNSPNYTNFFCHHMNKPE